MRKVNEEHQQILLQIKSRGLNFDELRKKYKLPFVVKLFSYLKEESREGSGNFEIIYPKNIKPADNTYIEELYRTGLKLHHWTEPFIDEDTSQIVDVDRYAFKAIRMGLGDNESGIEFGKGFVRRMV
jgi:hypothetical protein